MNPSQDILTQVLYDRCVAMAPGTNKTVIPNHNDVDTEIPQEILVNLKPKIKL